MFPYNNQKNFYGLATLLRSEFVKKFENASSTANSRFVWDYWYHENQYHLIRTPAHHFFSKKIYVDFHSQLVQWGRRFLGCHDVSPPWLSYYVDGCYQKTHADVPHGPWAFVYSLTPQSRRFLGGETFIYKNESLDYWKFFYDQQGREYKDFYHIIPPVFNQLTVFDPRRPHGVTEVKGTRDPLKARLVIHGWFVEPRPYVEGGLSAASTARVLDRVFVEIQKNLIQYQSLHGCLAIRLHVKKNGDVAQYQLVSNSIVNLNDATDSNKSLYIFLKATFSKIVFPAAKSTSFVTIPLLFR